MGKFVIRRVSTGIKFDLKAANGQTILTSEVYHSEAGCRSGIESVRKNALLAKLEDRTVEPLERRTNPKFEIFRDRRGEFRFRLRARNGEIIAASEGYALKSGCLNGIESVRKNAVSGEITVQESEI